jgi:hypothetical protein
MRLSPSRERLTEFLRGIPMSTSIACEDETCAAGNDDAPAASIATGMLGVGIVPFVDRKRARTERDQPRQGDPRRDYEDLVDLVRTEMAEPSR